MSQSVLTLNAGSSNLKFALFGVAGAAVMRGKIEHMDSAPHLLAHDAAGAVLLERRWPAECADLSSEVVGTLLHLADTQGGPARLGAAGHRVVHGGAHHAAPVQVTPALLADLQGLTPLAPLHMPANVVLIQIIAAARPSLAQVACFDTAFHHTLPTVARQFALPRAVSDAGVRRYGFHGLSYEHIAASLLQHAPGLARGRVVVAHLGAGASLCAMLDGRSIATTTGFSALDGLMMATRCGTLDPGVVLYLGRQGHGLDDIEDMLYRRSGLLGVSGISGDVRVLLDSHDPLAREALELFTYRIAGETAAMACALGGLDGLVFTGGVGEHAPAIRAAVCARLAWLGVRLDDAANAAASGAGISARDSSVKVHVIATDEEAVIARHTRAVLGLEAS